MGKDGLGFNIDTPNEIRIRELEQENTKLNTQLAALQWRPVAPGSMPDEAQNEFVLVWWRQDWVQGQDEEDSTVHPAHCEPVLASWLNRYGSGHALFWKPIDPPTQVSNGSIQSS